MEVGLSLASHALAHPCAGWPSKTCSLPSQWSRRRSVGTPRRIQSGNAAAADDALALKLSGRSRRPAEASVEASRNATELFTRTPLRISAESVGSEQACASGRWDSESSTPWELTSTTGDLRSTWRNLASLSRNVAPSSRDLPGASGTSSSRRFLLASLGVGAASSLVFEAASPPPAKAENVRLEDVDSRELQEALEAAFGGDLEAADQMFGLLIEKNPESASMWSNRGSVRLSLGRFQEAAADFSRAVELAPLAAVPFLNRAIAFEALGRLDEAVDDCVQAINNDPHESAAWFNLGNIETKRKEYKKALEAYQTAADLSPGIAGYRLREASALFQVGFATDAEKLVRSIVRKYPNYAEAHAALAGMLWGEGSLGPAEEQLSEAIEWEPNFRSLIWVNSNIEWPPKLRKAYEDFLTLK